MDGNLLTQISKGVFWSSRPPASNWDSDWGAVTMAMRECPYCGKMVYDRLTQCTQCRETLPPVKVTTGNRAHTSEGSDKIRRGLLFMLLAAVIGYFTSGSSPFNVPVFVPHAVIVYLSPLLFLGGLGLTFHGVYLQLRHSH